MSAAISSPSVSRTPRAVRLVDQDLRHLGAAAHLIALTLDQTDQPAHQAPVPPIAECTPHCRSRKEIRA